MARKGVIEQNGLGPRVITMAAGGMGSRHIAEALAKEGVNLSHVAVANYLNASTADRKEATEHVKAAVQAELQREALSDVQELEKLRDVLKNMVYDEPPQAIGMVGPLYDPKTGKPVVDKPLWLRATRELRDTLALRVKIAGAGGDDVTVQFEQKILSRDEVLKKAQAMGLMP